MFLQVTVETHFPFWVPVPKCVKLMYHLKLLVLLKSELGKDKVAVILHVHSDGFCILSCLGRNMLIKSSSSVIGLMESSLSTM